MSRSQRKPLRLSKPCSKDSIVTAIHDLNAKIDRLGENVLPKQPYLISVPSDVPYRHSSRFVNTWHVGTPFEQREEQLQYVSFLPHQEEEEDLLRIEGGWWDDQGEALDEEPSPKINYNSGRNTPLDSSQRKKITLKDYNTKDKVPLPGGNPQPGPSLPEAPPQEFKNRSPASTKVKVAETDEVLVKPPQSHKMDSSIQAKAMSNGPPALDGPSSPKPPPAINADDDSARPSKRRKISPSLALDAMLTPEKDHLKKIPQLLSPTLPSPERNNDLPELLSPLLPPTLVKAIATPPPSNDHERNRSHHRSESVRSILANAIGESSPRLNEKNGTASVPLSGSRIRSDSQHSVRSNASGTTLNKTLAQVKSTEATSKPGTPWLSASRSPRPRQRHIVALKYGKKNRKRVEALLKFAARPKKLTVKAEAENVPKSELRPQTGLPKETPKSQIHQEASDSPAKSKPAHSPLDQNKRPTTPIPAKTPSSTSPSMSKAVYNTPKKEFKSTAMRRVESADGGDPSTPGDRGRGSTPLGGERTSLPAKTSPAPSSVPSVREEDRQAWAKVNQKHFQLGRTIKHEGQALAEKDPPKSVALLVEALICFMINLAAQFCSRPGVDPGWRTILGYHIFLFRASRKFPPLHGLVVQLGAVCRQLIHKYDMERLGRDPLPDDHLGSAPTPGSDGNTKTHEDGEKYKKKYLDFRNELVQNAQELQTAWLYGSRHLSIEALQRDFPNTWAGRSKDFKSRGAEKPTPAKMATGYFLPLDPASTAFEAAQYGLAVLGDWADNEDVDWRPRIEL